MAVLGAIEIQMLADLARLRSDMDQAKRAVGDATAYMERAAGVAKAALGAIGIGLSAGALIGWVKSAIAAADETSKMAQRMGVAAEEVAGLRMAFEMGGSSAQAMQTSVSRLARGMADGNKALDAMGISARNADGTLRSTRDVLGDVADRFASYADGASKTAIAQELFGRAGAEMIPVLNAGSQGLAEMDAMARKLGLTIDTETGKKAELFNDTLDLMKRAGHGVATQMAAQLLPTLNNMAGALFNSMTEGDRLSKVADVLGAALKGLFTVGAVGVEVFNTVGKSLGMVAAAAVAVARGEFTQAMGILREGSADIKAGWGSTLRDVQAAWSDAGGAGVAALAAINREQPPVVAGTERLAKATREVSAAMREKQLMADRALRAIKAVDAAEAEAEARRLAIIKTEAGIAADRSLRALYAQDAAEAEAQARIDAQTKADQQLQEKALADWQRTWDQVGQSLSDALMQGGKSAAEYLKGLFRSLVLRPVLEAAVSPLTNALRSAMTQAVGGGGGAGGMNFAQSGGLMALAPMAGAYLLGRELGQMVSGGYAISGSGNTFTNLGGVVGGIANRLFGRRVADTGVEGTFTGAGGFSGQGFEFQKGGFLRSDKTVATALDPELASVLGAGAQAVSAQAQAYARALGLPAQAMLGLSQSIKVSLKDMTPEQIERAIRETLAGFNDKLAGAFAAQLTPLQRAGETIGQTLERLGMLQQFSVTLNDLGGVFSRLANLSVDAREHLLGLAGGMEALGQRALAFVQEFYSREEIAGLKAREIQAALASVGIQQDIGSREEFRALVDSVNVATEEGRRQLDTLLRVAASVAQVTDYLTETGQTLSGTAALAPTTGPVPDLLGNALQRDQLEAINNVATGVYQMRDAVYELIDVVRETGRQQIPGTWEVQVP